jgi:probable HAF family extracellular repeat protein
VWGIAAGTRRDFKTPRIHLGRKVAHNPNGRNEMRPFNVVSAVILLLSMVTGYVYGEVLYTVTDLGTLGGSYTQSSAMGINNSGQVAGWSGTTGDAAQHAFLYSGSQMTDLGTLGGVYTNSNANSINNSGQIVGWSFSADLSNQHAFLYGNGTMTDLNSLIARSSGWKLYGAHGINDNGWIVGTGINSSGQYHAFLLTPVPEASTLALMGIAAVSLTRHTRRHRRAA